MSEKESDMGFIDVVFDGPPSHESGRFVEVEDGQGRSINVGEWIDRGDGLWALRIQRASSSYLTADRDALAKALWVLQATDESLSSEWADRAWADMGGSEPSEERVEYELLADALAPIVEQMLAEARAEARAEALRGVQFRVDVACDGYAALTKGDVPEGALCVEDYVAGAAEAAREIRAALRADAAEREAR